LLPVVPILRGRVAKINHNRDRILSFVRESRQRRWIFRQLWQSIMPDEFQNASLGKNKAEE
jgi:hypothetical protein